MVNSDRVVVAELAEELATIGDGVMKVAGDLDCLALLLLDKSLDVLFRLSHILGSTGQFDASLAVTLTRNVNRDIKLGLKLALGVTTTANQRAVVLDRNIHDLSDLILALTNNLLNTLNDLVHNIGSALNLDGVSICFLLGELDGAGKLSSVVRAASLDDNVTEVGTCEDSLLLENLLSLGNLRSCTLDLDFNNIGVPILWDINSSTGSLAKFVESSTTLANERSDLLLLDRNGSGGRVLLKVLVEGVNLIPSLIRALLGTSDHNLVSRLLSSSLSLGLGSLELNLAVLNLDFDIEAVSELSNVAATLANQVIGKLLGEVERQGESSLLLILLFLLDESVGFGGERLNGRGRASESDVGSDLGNPDRDLISLSAFLLLLDESSKAFVELSRDIKSSTGDSFLLIDQVKNVLLGILNVLALARVELPRKSITLGERGVDVRVVKLLEALDLSTLTEISGHVASVSGSATRCVAVESSNVQVRHLHAHGQIHSLLHTNTDLSRRADDGDCIVVLVGGEQDRTAGISKELLYRNTSVTNNELVTATLNRQLLGGELLMELSNLALDLGANLLNSGTVASKLDMALVITSRGEESGRDASNLSLNIGRSLASYLEDLITSRSSREGITLNGNVNGGIVILLINGVVLVDLGKLDLGTGLLLEGLDHRTSLTNDVRTGRLGNGNFDSSLEDVSVIHKTEDDGLTRVPI
ncbi:hypothetical protein HG530_009849 [Fusarium avenaceum]|nr:hypothetical protein HG530_009849 [Fusarium avenaceum]